VTGAAADGVHLWATTIDDATVQAAWSLLAPQEAAHAREFGSLPARDRFLVGRGLTRSVLGRNLDVPPHYLLFETEPDGKPQLAGPYRLQFNLSHSGSLAVLAVAGARAVGVDIEQLNRRVDIEAVARRQFTDAECRLIAEADQAQVSSLFFTLWVRKEAVIKAAGTGFSVATRTIEVGLDERASFQGRTWIVKSFDVAEGYAAAVAVEDVHRPVSVPAAAATWELLDHGRQQR
jgi:4'-phosphopantetheinyl transferase